MQTGHPPHAANVHLSSHVFELVAHQARQAGGGAGGRGGAPGGEEGGGGGASE